MRQGRKTDLTIHCAVAGVIVALALLQLFF
jgi:hypothetical protein